MTNEQKFTTLMKRFVPVAVDMAAALLPYSVEPSRSAASAPVSKRKGHLRLTSDIRNDGLQRVQLSLRHSVSGDHGATLVLMRVGADLRVTATQMGSPVVRIGPQSDVETVLARYVPESKYVAGVLFDAVEERESALMEIADDFVREDKARYRLETDFLPDGPIVRFAVAWSGNDQSLYHPVPLIACGAPGLVKPPVPTPEQRERYAWLLDAIPSKV